MDAARQQNAPTPSNPSSTPRQNARQAQLKQYRELTSRLLNRMCKLVVNGNGQIPLARFPTDENIKSIFTSILTALATAKVSYLDDEVWHFPELERHLKLETAKQFLCPDHLEEPTAETCLDRIFEVMATILTDFKRLADGKDGLELETERFEAVTDRLATAEAALLEARSKLDHIVSATTVRAEKDAVVADIERLERLGVDFTSHWDLIDHASALLDASQFEDAIAVLDGLKESLAPALDHFEVRRNAVGDFTAAREAAALLKDPAGTDALPQIEEPSVVLLQPVEDGSEPAPENVEPYLNALRRFWSDGILTEDEQRTLSLLRRSLKISEGVHEQLEAEVRSELGMDAGLGEALNTDIAPVTAPSGAACTETEMAAVGGMAGVAGPTGATSTTGPPPSLPDLPPPPTAPSDGMPPPPPDVGSATTGARVSLQPLPTPGDGSPTPLQPTQPVSEPTTTAPPPPPDASAPTTTVPEEPQPPQPPEPLCVSLPPAAEEAVTYLDNDQPERALSLINSLMASAPTSSGLWFYKGQALRALGQHQAALESLNTAMSHGASGPELWYMMGSVMEGLEEYDEALGCYDRVVKIDRTHGRSWYNKARLLAQRKGDLEGSLTALEQVLKLLPNNEKVIMYKGIVLKKLGRTRSALECFDAVLKINPKNVYAIRCKRATTTELEDAEDRVLVADKPVRCAICMGYIKTGWNIVRCDCGKTYHESCSKRLKQCPYCSKKLTRR